MRQKGNTNQTLIYLFCVVKKREQNGKGKNEETKEELLKTKLSNKDVNLIMYKMEVSQDTAERKLRKYKEDMVDALVDMTK